MQDVEVATEREAQIEGAKNLYRYNRGDLFNVCVWLAIAGACAIVAWLVVVVVGHHEPAGTCHTVAACNQWILHHPVPKIKAPPGFPLFHPPPVGSTP